MVNVAHPARVSNTSAGWGLTCLTQRKRVQESLIIPCSECTQKLKARRFAVPSLHSVRPMVLKLFYPQLSANPVGAGGANQSVPYEQPLVEPQLMQR
jgi:hypothetical protein